MKSEHLVNLPVSILVTVLDSQHANVSCETIVFDAIKDWTTADPETRQDDCCKRLLKCVRWTKLTQKEINQIVSR